MEARTREDEIAEKLLSAFADYMEEQDGERMEEVMAQVAARKKREGHLRRKKWLRYAAAFAMVLIVGTVVLPTTEAHAWFVWRLDLLFGNHSDHVEIRPDDGQQFPQFYVGEIPEGFEVADTQENTGVIFIQYVNKEKKYISFTQTQRSGFKAAEDNEHRTERNELIADFDVRISEGDEDIVFEFTTDAVDVMVQTNAGYEVGAEFLKNLKEF